MEIKNRKAAPTNLTHTHTHTHKHMHAQSTPPSFPPIALSSQTTHKYTHSHNIGIKREGRGLYPPTFSSLKRRENKKDGRYASPTPKKAERL